MLRFLCSLLDELTFTFAVNMPGTGTATGTILVSNNAYYWSALGSVAANSSITWTSSVATVTTSAAHGFTTGQYVTIAGATVATYNGTKP
jgi:hypothetical protein